jgi:hypothetical protein
MLAFGVCQPAPSLAAHFAKSHANRADHGIVG